MLDPTTHSVTHVSKLIDTFVNQAILALIRNKFVQMF